MECFYLKICVQIIIMVGLSRSKILGIKFTVGVFRACRIGKERRS